MPTILGFYAHPLFGYGVATTDTADTTTTTTTTITTTTATTTTRILNIVTRW